MKNPEVEQPILEEGENAVMHWLIPGFSLLPAGLFLGCELFSASFVFEVLFHNVTSTKSSLISDLFTVLFLWIGSN